MLFDIACKECEYAEEVSIPLAEYEELKESGVCPECEAVKTLYQDYSNRKSLTYVLKGTGWTGRYTSHSHRTGTQDALDGALEENDQLQYAATHEKKFLEQDKKLKDHEEKMDKLGGMV